MTGVDVDALSLHSPEMSVSDMDGLKESIATVGQIVPAVIWRGKLVDGRKRKAACEALGIELKTITLPDDAKRIEHVRALNLLRTHYTQSQRAMFGAYLANATKADGPLIRERGPSPTKSAEPGSLPNSAMIPIAQAAEMTGSKITTVVTAKRVRRDAILEVAEAVQRGDLTVYAAGKIAELPLSEQPALLDKALAAKSSGHRLPAGTIVPKSTAPRMRNRPDAEVFNNFIVALGHSAGALGDFAKGIELPQDAVLRLEWLQELAKVAQIVRTIRRRLSEEEGGDEQ